MIAGAPDGDSPVHSPVPDSFESVASAPTHEVSTQHFIHDSDPDQASSAALIPSYAYEHDDLEDSDPVFPPGFDPDRDIEYIPMDQHMEDPDDPIDPIDPFDPDFDFDMAFDDPEPALAPEQAAALDLPVEPIPADPPVGDLFVDVPLIVDDHAMADDPVVDPVVDPPFVDPPLIADVPIDHPVDPVIAPFDPVPLEPEHALFAAHMDPPDEGAQHGWIPADEDVPPLPPQIPVTRHDDFSFQIPQFIAPAGPGEGSSAHPFGHVPMPMPLMPQISPVSASISPFPIVPFGPVSESLSWSSPPVMPPTDPSHMGHTIEDLLMSFVHQHESHTQRLQELERAQLPPCPCHGQSSSSFQPFRSLPPDYAARLLTLEQQIASVIRTQQALEEDWLHLRRLLYPHFPPPPPPPA
ncbi:hypothetical protein Hdeb2414_s0004g00135441 [Helianthus debilis subsp. tardiflorus]